MKKIIIPVSIGQSLRDIHDLGFLKLALERNKHIEIHLLTPSWAFAEFTNKFREYERTYIHRLDTPTTIGGNARLVRLRKRYRKGWFVNAISKLEQSRYEVPKYLKDIFKKIQPDLVMLMHPLTTHEYPLCMMARQAGVRLIAVVRSWDNLLKGLNCLADDISVWNQINFDHAVEKNGYSPEQVTINGAISFDPYLNDTSENKLHEIFNFPKGKKVITYATVGTYNLGYYGMDETHFADKILKMMTTNEHLKDTHLIIRLHPVSRPDTYQKYLDQYDNVSLSYAGYMPGMLWYSDYDDVQMQCQILRHSDVIVTPTSSWGIEAAIFDTPTVVPIFSDVQPAYGHAHFIEMAMEKHYKPFGDNKWLPLPTNYEEMERDIEESITHPDKYKAKRAEIVDNYVHFRDGKSKERVLDWMMKFV